VPRVFPVADLDDAPAAAGPISFEERLSVISLDRLTSIVVFAEWAAPSPQVE
jgi:hypothetical protein